MVTTFAPLAASTPGLLEETAALAERLRRSVVIVRDGGRGSGSGVIWRPEGVIVTNYHVAPGRGAAVTLADGRSFNASVRAADPNNDLAILQIPATGLPAVEAGDSDRLRVGELVFAVGNPLGLAGAVTAGIVTATPRYGGPAGDGRMLIQADVSLAPGNSGGPLATADGRVVGINSMMRTPGLALAVPSRLVTNLLEQRAGKRPYLGVTLLETELPRGFVAAEGRGAGFLVTGVMASGPAERAGLIVGDVLVSIDGRPTRSQAELTAALAGLNPDAPAELGILHGGQYGSLKLVTGEMLDEAA